MKMIYKVMAAVLMFCMLLALPTLAASEERASAETASEDIASAEASAEASDEASGEASAELDTQPFQVKIPYYDTTYGFGHVKLNVKGEVASDGTYIVDSVKCFGYELISYMTDDYYEELCGLLIDAGIAYEA